MCCKVAMVWTLSIQGDIPFAQNNTTINGTWQLLAYLSGPCWSASQLYRHSPTDCNRTHHYFPWSSNDSANPCLVQQRGLLLLGACNTPRFSVFQNFHPDIWSSFIYLYVHPSTFIHLSINYFYTIPTCLSVNWCAGRWQSVLSG